MPQSFVFIWIELCKTIYNVICIRDKNIDLYKEFNFGKNAVCIKKKRKYVFKQF